MEFKVGDVVYCIDPELKEYCSEVCELPAIVYEIGNYTSFTNYSDGVKLRFIGIKYIKDTYHGSRLRFCIPASSLIKELF
jgi:hypothetical protein